MVHLKPANTPCHELVDANAKPEPSLVGCEKEVTVLVLAFERRAFLEPPLTLYEAEEKPSGKSVPLYSPLIHFASPPRR